jgi:hypothetical protein
MNGSFWLFQWKLRDARRESRYGKHACQHSQSDSLGQNNVSEKSTQHSLLY